MPWKKTNVNHPIRPGKPVAGEIEILGMEISMVQTDWVFFLRCFDFIRQKLPQLPEGKYTIVIAVIIPN